jgi:hypothetical protein
LNSPEGLGIDSSTIKDGPYLVHFIDYNDTYMELYIADVGDNTFKEVGKQILNLQGAKRMAQFQKEFVSTTLSSIQLGTNLIFRTSGYTGDVYTGKAKTSSTSVEHLRHQDVKHLHAIVFSGDAPPALIQRIRNIITDLLPGQAEKVRDSIDPLYVGAIGAAEWAKRQAEDPKIMKDPAHDEL